MKPTLLLIFLILFHFIGRAQNTFIVGERSYQTTPEFKLHQISDGIGGYQMKSDPIKIAFGPEGDGAILIVSKNIFQYQSKFIGKLLIYLEDNTVITCQDRGFNDIVNNLVSKVYFLTSSELKKLRESNINGIRYSFSDAIGDVRDFIVYNVEYSESPSLLSGDLSGRSREFPKTNFPSEIKKIGL